MIWIIASLPIWIVGTLLLIVAICSLVAGIRYGADPANPMLVAVTIRLYGAFVALSAASCVAFLIAAKVAS